MDAEAGGGSLKKQSPSERFREACTVFAFKLSVQFVQQQCLLAAAFILVYNHLACTYGTAVVFNFIEIQPL